MVWIGSNRSDSVIFWLLKLIFATLCSTQINAEQSAMDSHSKMKMEETPKPSDLVLNLLRNIRPMAMDLAGSSHPVALYSFGIVVLRDAGIVGSLATRVCMAKTHAAMFFIYGLVDGILTNICGKRTLWMLLLPGAAWVSSQLCGLGLWLPIFGYFHDNCRWGLWGIYRFVKSFIFWTSYPTGKEFTPDLSWDFSNYSLILRGY